jgi:hypothetical protein
MSRSRAALKKRAELLEDQLMAVNTQLAEKEGKVDLSDLPNSSVISFFKSFQEFGNVYEYAAIKIQDRWFTTGPRSRDSYSDGELEDFIGDEKVWVVGEWTPLDELPTS